ncbi:LpxL/LpxP family acyltransferase [Pseudoxanthomonas beigongshangi]
MVSTYMLTPHLLTHFARPLHLIDRRIGLIEKWLKTPLSEDDEHSIRIACEESGKRRFGAYYHWYLQKKIVAETVRDADRERFLGLMQSSDHTNYRAVIDLLDSDEGLLIAIPHHAHYILSIAMLAEVLRPRRPVYLFYGNPESHPGNEVFDKLNDWFWGRNSNVAFAHDTPKGLATAMRQLKSGAAIFIMPDVFKDVNQTLSIPFCGRSLNVMLGTSILARKTGARILPMISTPHGNGLGFKSEFGESFLVAQPSRGHPEIVEANDYRIVRRIFHFYEQFMSVQTLYWQNMRSHISRSHSFARLSKDMVLRASELILSDPDVRSPEHVVDLRGFA